MSRSTALVYVDIGGNVGQIVRVVRCRTGEVSAQADTGEATLDEKALPEDKYIDLSGSPASATRDAATATFSATTVVADSTTSITISNIVSGDVINIRGAGKTSITATGTTQALEFATPGTYYVDVIHAYPKKPLLDTEITAT